MTDYTSLDTIYDRKVRLKTITCKVTHDDGGATPEFFVTSPMGAVVITLSIFAELDDDQEHLVLLVLNSAGRVKGFKHLASGGMASADADLKIVFRSALLLGACHVVLIHNHPSGSPTPSREDIELTRVMIEAGRILGIGVMDHVIITPYGDHYSIAEHEDRHGLEF